MIRQLVFNDRYSSRTLISWYHNIKPSWNFKPSWIFCCKMMEVAVVPIGTRGCARHSQITTFNIPTLGFLQARFTIQPTVSVFYLLVVWVKFFNFSYEYNWNFKNNYFSIFMLQILSLVAVVQNASKSPKQCLLS